MSLAIDDESRIEEVFLKTTEAVRDFMTAMEQDVDVDLTPERVAFRKRLIDEELGEFSAERAELLAGVKDTGNFIKELVDLHYVIAGLGVTFGAEADPYVEYPVEDYMTTKFAVSSVITYTRAMSLYLTSHAMSKGRVSFLLAYYWKTIIHATLYICERMGVDFMEAFNEVHTSNMSKLGPDGKPIYREDGKVLKGPNYRKADMSRFAVKGF